MNKQLHISCSLEECLTVSDNFLVKAWYQDLRKSLQYLRSLFVSAVHLKPIASGIWSSLLHLSSFLCFKHPKVPWSGTDSCWSITQSEFHWILFSRWPNNFYRHRTIVSPSARTEQNLSINQTLMFDQLM
jgi:hypothetical protein